MTTITNAIFTDAGHTLIGADFDGAPTHFPADPTYREYRKLVAAGITPGDFVPPPKPTVIAFGDFAARFTEAERIGVARVARTVDPATGEPLYANVAEKIDMQGSINLESAALGAFMDILIGKGVIDAARKAKVLDPEWSP